MKQKLLASLGLVLLIFVVVWVAVVVRWRMTGSNPDTMEMVLYLGALPLGLVLTFAGIYKLADSLQKRKQQKQSDTELADQPVEQDEADPTLDWQLSLLAADTVLAAGNSSAALIKAAQKQQRPTLHDSLKNSSAAPVMACAVKDVDLSLIDETLPQALRDWGEGRRRALALAERLATRLLDAHFEALASAAGAGAPSPDTVPVLLLDWWLPSDWQPEDVQQAAIWMQTRLAEQGWAAPAVQLRASALQDELDVLRQLDEMTLAYHQAKLHLPVLLLVSDSQIDPELVAVWSDAGQLHDAGNAEGRVPGEGAAALLVAPADHAGELLPVKLGRLFVGSRAKPVDAPQKLQADTLKQLADMAKAHAAWDGDGEWTLVSDTDVRASRAVESLIFAEGLLPEQDAATALLPVGIANGAVAAPLSLATVAVAVHVSAEAGMPSLIFSHQHASLRAVMLVIPTPLEPLDAAASAA